MTDKRLRQLEEFLSEHGSMIANALNIYAREMSKESASALASYSAICADPNLRARQDKAFITTNGLLMISQMMQDSANRATAARHALEDLEDDQS